MTRKQETRVRQEQIAEAALAVIAAHGISGLSMERVARLVGIVPSALYRHFSGKDEVLDAVLELLRDRLLSMVDGVIAEYDVPLEQLRALLRRHVALVQHFQMFPRVLFADQVWVGEPARKARLFSILSDYLSGITRIAAEGQRRGEIRSDIPANTVAVMMLGLFQPTVLMWFLSDGGFDVAKHVELAWNTFLSGIQPPSEHTT